MKQLYIFCFFLLFASQTHAQSSSWASVAGGPTGASVKRVRLDASGNLLAYSSSDGKIYKSIDGGTNWTTLNIPSGYVEDFELDGAKLLLLQWNMLYSSTDGGGTWTKTNSTAFENGQEITKVPGVNGYLIVGDQGARISLDAGVTWKKIYDGNSENVAFSSAGDIYIADPKVGIVKHPTQSSLAGWDASKWQTVYPKEFAGSDFVLSVGVNPAASNKVYITYRKADNTGTLMKSSSNGGVSWTVVTPPSPDVQGNLWYSFTTDNKFYFVSGSIIYDVTEGASPTFTLKKSPGYSYYWIKDLFYKGNNEIYSGLDGDGIWKSNDGLITWTDISGSTQASGIAVPPGRDVEMAGVNLLFLKDYGAKAYWYTTNNGATFTRRDLSFSFQSPATGKILKKIQTGAVIAGTSSGTQMTSDGINWGQLSTSAFADYVTVGTSDIYGFSNNGVIKKSVITNSVPSDFTTTITPAGLPASYVLNNVTYNNGFFFMAITNSSVSPSQQQYWKLNGASFVATQITSSLSTQPGSLSGIFAMNNKLYVGDKQQIAISSDQGSSFSYLTYNHQRILPVLQNGNALGVSSTGTFATTKDDGKSWSSNAVPNEQVVIQNIYASSSALSFAAAYNAPLLKSDSIVRVSSSAFIDFGWTKLSGPYGGGGRKLFKNPSGTLFAEAFFSVHRYNSTASSWETLESVTMNNHAAYVDASGAIYHCTWGEIFKSTDNGDTFSKLTGTFTNANGGGFFKDASNNLYVLTDGGIYRSTNDGASFSKPASASSGSFYEMVQSGSTLLATKVESNAMSLMRSVDNGATWSAVSGVVFPNANRTQNVLASTTNAFVVVTSDNIYKSTDGGVTWSSIKSNITETSFSDFGSTAFFGAAGEYYFYVLGYPGKIYSSTDQGATWSIKASASTNRLNDIRSFVWVGSRLYAYSVYQGISYSDDGAVTFTSFQNDKGLYNNQGEVKSIDGTLLFASGNDLMSSTDAGNTWNKISSESPAHFLDLQNGDIIAYQGSIVKSTDRGLSWSTVLPNGHYLRSLVQTSNLYVAHGRIGNGTDGQFYSSSDLINWSTLTFFGLPTSFPIYGTSMAALGDQVFLTFFNNEVSRNQFYKLSLGAATQITVAADPRTVVSNNGKLFVYSAEGALYETSNGTSWIKRATPAGDNFSIATNGYLFVTGNSGLVWVSRDSGASWQNVSATNFAAAFTNISIDLSSGYAYGTAKERGVLKSASIVMPNDKMAPAVTSLLPANNAANVALAGLKLTLTFNEVPKKVSGKKIKLFDLSSPSIAVETFDASGGTVSGNSVSFAPSVTLGDVRTYFVTVEAGSFTDIFGNAFGGIVNSSDWRFTTLDATPPVLTFTTSNLDKGVAKEFSIDATDNKGLAEDKIKIYYRGISALSATSFQSASLSVAQGAGTPSIKAKTAVNEAWYDGMGLEFYFEVEDPSGNKSRLPQASTDYFYSYINYPTAAKPKIAGLGFGGTPTSYKVISIPFELADSKASTIFDELGGSNKSVWRLLTYAGDNNWNDIADGNLINIERGKGYWVNIKNFAEVFVEGASTPVNNRNSFFTINLNPGWNQIGNPYPVSISWEEAISGKPEIGKVKVYNNGAYSNGDILGPYEGGFVYVSGGAQTVKVRFKGILTGGRAAATNHNIDLPTWDLPITVTQGDTKNELPGIGMNPDATQGVDNYDEPALPMFAGVPHVELLFEKSSIHLNKDVVNTQDAYVWNFNLSTSQREDAVLRWKNDELKNSAKDLFLFDLKRQTLINMKEHSQYTFNAGESKNFQIHFGNNLEGKIKPTSNVIGSVYPNPVQNMLSIPVTVDERSNGSSVALHIFDHTGSLIQTMRSENLEPGFYTLQNQLEGNLQNGLYIVKVMLATPNGIQSQTTKMIVNR